MEGFAIAQERRRETQLEKDRPVVSEEIEKDAIKGYLICVQNCSTYAAILRVKTSIYKTTTNRMVFSKEPMQFIST
jgi:hypothetical protein